MYSDSYYPSIFLGGIASQLFPTLPDRHILLKYSNSHHGRIIYWSFEFIINNKTPLFWQAALRTTGREEARASHSPTCGRRSCSRHASQSRTSLRGPALVLDSLLDQ